MARHVTTIDLRHSLGYDGDWSWAANLLEECAVAGQAGERGLRMHKPVVAVEEQVGGEARQIINFADMLGRFAIYPNLCITDIRSLPFPFILFRR